MKFFGIVKSAREFLGRLNLEEGSHGSRRMKAVRATLARPGRPTIRLLEFQSRLDAGTAPCWPRDQGRRRFGDHLCARVLRRPLPRAQDRSLSRPVLFYFPSPKVDTPADALRPADLLLPVHVW